MLQSHAPARLGPLAAAAWRQCAALLQQQQQHAGMSTAKSTFAVPEGHHSSDLSSTACHIGLGRRRDLTMRQDLRLWEGGKELSLAEVFNNFKTLLVGLPGGKICTEQHTPGYLQAAAELKAAGVDKVVCVVVDEPQAVAAWAASNGFDKQPSTLQVVSDAKGAFARLLGLELGAEGPPCQRYAGVVDNGILLRLKVEAAPAELKVTDVKSMMKTFADAYA